MVDGLFAVARKQRLRTRGGNAYLALELVDSSGRIDARVWNDVDLLDKRFREGDAVRVLGRVERFRDRLQLEVRSLEPAEADPATLIPEARRDVEELDGFFEFLAAEISHPGLRGIVDGFAGDAVFRERLRTLPATPDSHHSYSGGLLEHTVAVATLCREAAQLHPRLNSDILLTAALLHDVGRTETFRPGVTIAVSEQGRLLGHVLAGVRMIDAGARETGLADDVLLPLLNAVAGHHGPIEGRRLETPEAVALHHANTLDARVGEALSGHG